MTPDNRVLPSDWREKFATEDPRAIRDKALMLLEALDAFSYSEFELLTHQQSLILLRRLRGKLAQLERGDQRAS
jgi:hypothetical protein